MQYVYLLESLFKSAGVERVEVASEFDQAGALVDRLRRSGVESAFEGFFCSTDTRHGWWQQNA